MSVETTQAAEPNTTTLATGDKSAVTTAPVTEKAAEVTTATGTTLLTEPAAADGAKTEPVKAETAPEKKDEKVDPPKKEEKVVPEKYDIKLPEGSPLDTSAIDRIAAEAKAKGLSNEEAQSELNRESAAAANYKSVLENKTKEIQTQWVQSIHKDPEIGGANFKVSVQRAQKAIAKYGSESLKQELDSSGLGNHPELIRLLARIGNDMDDDKAVIGKSGNFSTSRLDRMYGKSKQGE